VDAIVGLPSSLLLGSGLILFPGLLILYHVFWVQSGGHFELEPPFQPVCYGCLVSD
jgi:hypothetical protein